MQVNAGILVEISIIFFQKAIYYFRFYLTQTIFYEKSHKRHQMIDQTGEILCIQNRIQVK